MRNIALLLFIGVMALGVFFRFYLIQDIPPGLYPDEATNGNNAVEALRTGVFKVFYPENNGREGLFINLQAIAIWILGAEPWVLRLVSTIFATLTIAGLWLLARELSLSPLLPFFSSFFLATSYWHINFSRIGFRAILVPFFATFGMYWLLKALRNGKISSAALAGISIGLGFHTYIAFRFMPLVIAIPLIFYLIQWLKARSKLSVSIGRPIDTDKRSCVPCITALFILVALVTALPMGLYFLQNPEDFIGRSGQVSIFSGENPFYEFAKSNLLTLQMFFWNGDCNPRHNLACQPQLFWPVAAFFAIGFILSIAEILRWLKFRASDLEFRVFEPPLAAFALLSWFAFMMLPATLTREGLPHALRSLGLIPPVFLLAGWGAVFLWEKIKHYLETAEEDPLWIERKAQINRIKKEAALLLAFISILITVNTYRAYFVHFPNRIETQNAFSTDLLQIGKYLNTLPRETKKIVLVNLSGGFVRGIKAPAQTVMFVTDTFDEARRREKMVEYVHTLPEISITPGEKVSVLPLYSGDQRLIREIRQRFPALRPKITGDFIVFENK